jgi:hypothetical protein
MGDDVTIENVLVYIDDRAVGFQQRVRGKKTQPADRAAAALVSAEFARLKRWILNGGGMKKPKPDTVRGPKQRLLTAVEQRALLKKKKLADAMLAAIVRGDSEHVLTQLAFKYERSGGQSLEGAE